MNNKKQRKDIMDKTSQIRTLPAEKELHKCIIVKDLTIRQREEWKQARKEKKKMKGTEVGATSAKTVEKDLSEQMDVQMFHEETIKDATTIEATVRNINEGDETLDGMNSQPILAPLNEFNPSPSSLLLDTILQRTQIGHAAHVSPISELGELGDETIIGGYDTLQNNLLAFSPITKKKD